MVPVPLDAFANTPLVFGVLVEETELIVLWEGEQKKIVAETAILDLFGGTTGMDSSTVMDRLSSARRSKSLKLSTAALSRFWISDCNDVSFPILGGRVVVEEK